MARRLGKERNEITLGPTGQSVTTQHRTRHLWSLHVFFSAKRHRLDTRSVPRRDVLQVGIAVSLPVTRRLMRTLLSFHPKGMCPAGFVWQLRRPINGTRKASLAFRSAVTEELVAMPAAPLADVVVASMCFLQQRDRCGHDRARW